ncbi:MAG: pepsin/retropepsin-like aspartic protease family protein [Planctomycetota bacterium]|jgi:hypothetical protein
MLRENIEHLRRCETAPPRSGLSLPPKSLTGTPLSAWGCAFILSLSWLCQGCGNVVAEPAPLFTVPFSIEGQDVGGAIVDTGGDFEVLLRESFGLSVVDTVDVVAFSGAQEVPVTEPFRYRAGGLEAVAASGIVDPSICDCNGVGFPFLRKTGLILAIDFVEPTVYFLRNMPRVDFLIPYQAPPEDLPDFDTSFIDVVIESGSESRVIRALLDTGATATVMRQDLLATDPVLPTDRLNISVSHEIMGTVAVNVGLYETQGIPDMIIGNDVMRAWGNQWFFVYHPFGGMFGVIRDMENSPSVRPVPVVGSSSAGL